MSYCRFGYDSDVYVYSSIEGGLWIHVAARRCLLSDGEERADPLDPTGYADLALPRAGEAFRVESLRDGVRALKELSGYGYVVPDYAFQRLAWEIQPPLSRRPMYRHGRWNRHGWKMRQMWDKTDKWKRIIQEIK